MSPAVNSSAAELLTDKLETSRLDDRSYRDIRLRNGLEALLVHDDKTDKASVTMSVAVGGLSDVHIRGAAHVVEHLVSMGTKKYPAENEYNQYLAKHSGSSNAVTGNAITTFFFDIAEMTTPMEPNPLHGALDRFAQFFINPLFLPSTLHSALMAVDSEFKVDIQNDECRISQLSRSLSNPKHPFFYCSRGNYDSLKIQPEALGLDIIYQFKEFYKKHYSANRMKLVVLSSEPLDLLEKWVVELFSTIPDKNLSQNRWESEEPYPRDFLCMQRFAKPVMNVMMLELLFPFLDEEYLCESQPSYYISHLIEHKGPGSVMHYIKSKGWAYSLGTVAIDICPGTRGMFLCQIGLTKEGLENYQSIVKVFFQYLSLLKEKGPQMGIFAELERMALINFDYAGKTPARSLTIETSIAMQKPLPRERLLSGQRHPQKFEPLLFTEGLGCLRPDNFCMLILSPDLTGCDQKETWYGTEYRTEKIPERFLAEISETFNSTTAERIPELHPPNPNKFIPANLEVMRKHVTQPAVAPLLIRNDDGVQVWFKKDDIFWVPRVMFIASLQSPVVYNSAKNAVMSKLITLLVEDALKAYSYDTNLAGLQYSITREFRGLVIDVTGYNDKLSVLLQEVITTVRHLDIKEEIFDTLKKSLTLQYKNWEFIPSYCQIDDYISLLTSHNDYFTNSLEKELSSVSLDTIRSYYKKLISNMSIETYAYGNLTEKDTLKLTSMVEKTLETGVYPKSQPSILRSWEFPPGSNFLYRKELLGPHNINHCLGYYLYIGNINNRKIRAKAQLMEQILKEPAFNQLRTKDQLGYIVQTGLHSCSTTYGFRFIIESERAPKHLESRIDSFLEQQFAAIKEMKDTDFEVHKRSVIHRRLERSDNFDKESRRYWNQIYSRHYDFEAPSADAAAIKGLTKHEMISFYAVHFVPTSSQRAKLAVHLIAKGEKASSVDVPIKEVTGNGTSPELITNIEEFKTRLGGGYEDIDSPPPCT